MHFRRLIKTRCNTPRTAPWEICSPDQLWCPVASSGANKRGEFICNPPTLAMLAAAVAKPRGHSSQPNSKSRWEAVKVWPTRGGRPTLTPSVKTNAPRNRHASTAPDRFDYVVCCGHDCTTHIPLERRQMAERRYSFQMEHSTSDPSGLGFFFVYRA